MPEAIEQCWIYRSAAPSSHFARNGVSLDFRVAFTPKNPVRLHKPSGQLPRWGAKNVLPLNLIALLEQGKVSCERFLGYGVSLPIVSSPFGRFII